MKQVNIHEAKTNFSKLLERIEAGEEIIIANRGIPKAVLSKYIVPDNDIPNNPWGRYAGQIEVSEDFDDEDPQINQMFGL